MKVDVVWGDGAVGVWVGGLEVLSGPTGWVREVLRQGLGELDAGIARRAEGAKQKQREQAGLTSREGSGVDNPEESGYIGPRAG